jgi:hypothetical protein
MLIATEGFAALNIVTPDFVVPNGFLFQGNGVINWGENSDTLSYSSLPTNGSARNRDGSSAAAEPKNFMGDSATIPVNNAKLPAALSGLWWNANESGWGIHFTQRGNNVFAAWYTYDASGNPKWYVSTCAMPSTTGTSGTCNGTLYEVNGPTFFGGAFDPARVFSYRLGAVKWSRPAQVRPEAVAVFRQDIKIFVRPSRPIRVQGSKDRNRRRSRAIKVPRISAGSRAKVVDGLRR